MLTYKEQIENMVYETERIIELYTQELERCMEGYLLCNRNHGKPTYYHAVRTEDKIKRISISKNDEIIKELARKEYLEQVIKVLKNNVKVLKKSGSEVEQTDIVYLREKMSTAYKGLPDEFFYGNSGVGRAINLNDNYLEGIKRHEGWAKEPYEMSDYMPGNRKFPTSAGFNVRSKSELLITEQLMDYSVPFRYEEVMWIGNKSFAPDFTFRDSSMENFYWEHAGMMNQPGYVSNHKWKMQMYENADIVPWKNLIVTYDMDGVISIPMIKGIIENEVLPRL